MSLKIICVGSEILDGRVVNTNLAYIGSQLRPHGILVDAEVTIPDDAAVIRREVLSGIENYDMVMTIGGLGPTRDDITKETVADALGLELKLNKDLIAVISERFRQRQRKRMSAALEKQATIPAGAQILANDWGIAPGLWIESDGKIVCMLPGPPREFEPIVDAHVLRRIMHSLPPARVTRTLRVLGIGESTVAKQVDAILEELPDIDVGYCVKPGGVDINLLTSPETSGCLNAAEDRISECFNRHFAMPDENHVTRICDMLRKWQGYWGTAESCTGGWIAKRITDEAGVSDVFDGGIVCYSNRLKVMMLGVDEDTLQAYGAVSGPVAREMVRGLTQRYNLYAGVAVTGIAGPDGGTREKPVGTVYIATAVKGDIKATRHVFPYGRRGMRERTVIAALDQLWHHMLEIEDGEKLAWIVSN